MATAPNPDALMLSSRDDDTDKLIVAIVTRFQAAAELAKTSPSPGRHFELETGAISDMV